LRSTQTTSRMIVGSLHQSRWQAWSRATKKAHGLHHAPFGDAAADAIDQ